MLQDLERVRNAWADCQASGDRNAIYGYLTAVYDLVAWWPGGPRNAEKSTERVNRRRTLAQERRAILARLACDGMRV
jgi:hypothetical protein